MSKGIYVSPRHGVNPSVAQCFFCMEDKNEVVLFGMLRGDVEAPRQACIDYEPCDKCAAIMQAGIILVSVRAGEEQKEDNKNPYRTGGWVALKEEALRRIITPPEVVDHILRTRFAFVPDDAWVRLGLPGIKAVRDCECRSCGHKETMDVERGPTPNISGELTKWCPKCGKKMDAEPTRYVQDNPEAPSS